MLLSQSTTSIVGYQKEYDFNPQQKELIFELSGFWSGSE